MTLTQPFSASQRFIFLLIVVAFICLHFSGLHIPYHQDEYKWVTTVNPALVAEGGIPHPPLGELIYRNGGEFFGWDNLRTVPFLFGLLNLFLIFYLARLLFGNKSALWAAGLFTLSFYSLLASLMVDTDGAVMPFFFLIACIGYFKWKDSGFASTRFLVLAIIGVLAGFLVKVSFAVAIAALALDFMVEKQVFSDLRRLWRYALGVFGGVLVLVAALFLAKLAFPYFHLTQSFDYWEHFAKFSGRGWGQTGIQFAKAILYTSPLLLVPLVCIDKETFRRTRPFFFFVFIGLFFYLIAFDFSTGALDRYFEFLVVPLCLICSGIFAKKINSSEKISWSVVTLSILAAIAIFTTQYLPQSVPALYPKSEWLHRALSLHWNFLFPFTGGSGPVGFYVSFLPIVLWWIVSCALVALVYWRSNLTKSVLIGVVILGLVYNGVFVEEYLFGRINGSPYPLIHDAVSYIESHPAITDVAVYNDTGGYDIQKTGKYWRRIYVAPQFEGGFSGMFGNFHGDILFINIPRVDAGNVYAQYIQTCQVIHEQQDVSITEQILDCSHATVAGLKL